MTTNPKMTPAHRNLHKKMLDARPRGQWWGIAAIVVVAAVAAALGAPPLMVVIATAFAAIPIALAVARLAATWQQGINELLLERESEIEIWRRRWQTLQQEARQTTSALSRMRDGVILLSQSLDILLINPSARRLLTLSSEQEFDGRPFAEIVRHPDLSRAVASAAAGDGTQKIVIEMTDGQVVRPIKVRVDRFADSGDNNLLMTLRDETESYRIDEMRREFVANISHEIKTPLAAIKGYAETVELAIKDDPDAAVHFMAQIQTQCLRLERLISDMMQLARAQVGRSQLNIQPLSMAKVVAESLKSYQPVAEAKNITLTYAEPKDDPIVRSDAEATLTIANNLIGNAIRYTPAGGQVLVTCRPAGKFWALVVEDTGIGIPPSEQKRIFERFYRVAKGRRSDGTGLGLSIVKNLAMTLGGEVRLSSQPGKGSRFEVLLPSGST